MTGRNLEKKKTVSWSVVVGTLLVPLSAVGAMMVAGAGESGGASPAPTVISTAPLTEGSPAIPDFEPGDTGADDLRSACGPSGFGLVTLESNGRATEVQQAALDALREICEQEGLSLPAPPTPEQIVETVVLADGGSPSPQEDAGSVEAAVGDDDHYEDDRDEYDDDREEDQIDRDDRDDDDDHDDDDDDDEEDDD